MAVIDPIDDIKAGFVTLLEQIPELNGKVFPELNDDNVAVYPAVCISIDEDIRLTTRTPLGKEIIIDATDPENVIVGRELLNAEYPVRVCIKSTSDSEKRLLAGKVLEKVLSVRRDTSMDGPPNGFYNLPSGAPSRIRYSGQVEERKEESENGNKWNKVWIREFTFVVNTVLIASDAQGYYTVDQVILDLYVNSGGLSMNNGETITIV